MSHGESGASKAEPNLTPLLDMVLQLLMFFMMCVNFVTRQVNENIQLPVMQSAKPMDKRETDLLYLNLTADGHLEVVGQQPLTRLSDMRAYLRTQASDLRRLAREKGVADWEKLKTMVILRADKAVDYKTVFQVLEMCKTAGYQRFQVRAMTRPGGNAG
jgi:biopolymer transport protein ExbD